MGMLAITGKPSGGKTMYAVSEILRLLHEDSRPIVTNVALILDECQRYMLANGFSLVDVYARVRLLSYNDSGQFWRFRGGPNAVDLGSAQTVERAKEWAARVADMSCKDRKLGLVLPEPPDNKSYTSEWLNVVLEAAAPVGGVMFFIDELHEHLNARNWQKHGLVASDYAAIHAHMGDDVYWISQAPTLVDSAFRVRAQEFLYCANGAKQVMLGYFNRAGQRQFKISSYLEPFTGSQQAQYVKHVALDARIAKCYKRSRFGVDGDTKEKRRGVHFYWLWVCCALFVIGACVLGVVFPQALTSMFLKRTLERATPPSASPAPASEKRDTVPVRKQGGSVVSSSGSASGVSDSGLKPVYTIVRETFRATQTGSNPYLRTSEEGTYRLGAMSTHGMVKGIQDHVVLCVAPDGALVYIVAVDSPSPAVVASTVPGSAGGGASPFVGAVPDGEKNKGLTSAR